MEKVGRAIKFIVIITGTLTFFNMLPIILYKVFG
jgi:hypothetical protein